VTTNKRGQRDSKARPLALADEELQLFLRRKRRNKGVVELPPLGAFLAETLSVTARLVPSQGGSLLLDDPTQRDKDAPLTFVAAFGSSARVMVGERIPGGRGIVGHVYQTGKTYASNNVSKDPLFFSELDGQTAFKTTSVIAAPLRLERKVCGVFELVNRTDKGGFSPRDIELVELVAEYISRAILNAVDIVKQNELAFRDDLTGLRNARGLEATLGAQVTLANRKKRDVGVMFIDMDKLKPLNDKFGHRVGSEAIRRTGLAIETIIGDAGIPFRFGGDEFVVILPGADKDRGLALAASIRKNLPALTAGPIRGGGTMPKLSATIGIATLRGSLRKGGSRSNGAVLSRLLTASDNALYRAKRAGLTRVAFATARDDNFGK